MRLFLAFAVGTSTLICFAAVPDVVITTLSSANGHATVGGRLTVQPEGPVGISVQNGNILYSTISDAQGRWAIVVRHLSSQVVATSWSLATPLERGNEVEAIVTPPFPSATNATGSSSSEKSANDQSEISMRWKNDSSKGVAGK